MGLTVSATSRTDQSPAAHQGFLVRFNCALCRLEVGAGMVLLPTKAGPLCQHVATFYPPLHAKGAMLSLSDLLDAIPYLPSN